MTKRIAACVLSIPLVLGATAIQSAAQSTGIPNASSAPIRGHYIVVFNDKVRNPRAEVASLNRNNSMRVKHIYDVALKGFAAQIPDAALVALQRNPNIAYIEQDQTVGIGALATQSAPLPWGLDRIDQSKPISVSGFDQKYNYIYDGTGVTAYVVDTGILSTHSEFKTVDSSRVVAGYSAIAGGTEDCNGHGTHVAGTVGGKTWGVAKNVTLVPVRVLDCSGSGSNSGVIAGVNYVAANASGKKAVANMSLGGGASSALDTAVRNAITATGVTFVVAAGNSNRDARNFSPARVLEAITVGATTSNDTRASYSNYGSIIDIFAPGSSIQSAWHTSSTSTNTISGTSMASPHVAGAVALLLEEKNLTVASTTPPTIRTLLIGDAEKDLILNTRGNPNNFLNTNYNKPRP